MSNDNLNSSDDQSGTQGAKAPWASPRLWLGVVVLVVVSIAVALTVDNEGSYSLDDPGAAGTADSEIAVVRVPSNAEPTNDDSAADGVGSEEIVAEADSSTSAVADAADPYFPTVGNVPQASTTTTYWPSGYKGNAPTTSVTLPQPGPQPTTTTTEPLPPPPPPTVNTTSTTTTEPLPPPPPPTTTTTEPLPPPPPPPTTTTTLTEPPPAP